MKISTVQEPFYPLFRGVFKIEKYKRQSNNSCTVLPRSAETLSCPPASLHPLPFSFELSRAKSEVRNLSWVFYTLQMSLLRMSLDYRLILTAWKILEIDGQTLVGVGGISSSFLGEVRSKNYSHIPMFSLQHLQQSTELKSNNFLQ